MFPDFEDMENRNDSDVDKTAADVQKFLDSLETPEEPSGKGGSELGEMYKYLEDIDKKYTYEKQKLPGGIVKESIVWKKTESPARDAENLYNIKEAKDVWRVQESNVSSAIACQEFIVEEYCGKKADDFSDFITENGAITSDNAGDILEAYGIDTHTRYGADFKDLEKVLDSGNRAIIGVNNMELDSGFEGIYPSWSANHTVEVIGIDKSNPDDIRVIVNDPGISDGCGKMLDYDRFMKAWGASDGFMVVADRP